MKEFKILVTIILIQVFGMSNVFALAPGGKLFIKLEKSVKNNSRKILINIVRESAAKKYKIKIIEEFGEEFNELSGQECDWLLIYRTLCNSAVYEDVNMTYNIFTNYFETNPESQLKFNKKVKEFMAPFEEAQKRIVLSDSRKIDLSKIGLKYWLPQKIMALIDWEKIISLDIHSNQLTSLEGITQEMPNLVWLGIYDNQLINLKGMPKILPALKVLRLEHNKLTSFQDLPFQPNEFWNLYIFNNPLSWQDSIDPKKLGKINAVFTDSEEGSNLKVDQISFEVTKKEDAEEVPSYSLSVLFAKRNKYNQQFAGEIKNMKFVSDSKNTEWHIILESIINQAKNIVLSKTMAKIMGISFENLEKQFKENFKKIKVYLSENSDSLACNDRTKLILDKRLLKNKIAAINETVHEFLHIITGIEDKSNIDTRVKNELNLYVIGLTLMINAGYGTTNKKGDSIISVAYEGLKDHFKALELYDFPYNWTYFNFIKNLVEKLKNTKTPVSISKASDILKGTEILLDNKNSEKSQFIFNSFILSAISA